MGHASIQGSIMNTDLNISNSLRQALSPAAAQATAKQAAAAPAQAVAAPVVQAPIKVKLQIDPEQSRKHVQEAIDRLNDAMKKTNQSLNFKMDDVINSPVVTVRNSVTGDVVRQIPNEVVVHVAHNIEKMKGLLHNSMS
jgi:flagellar protein FlaG